MCYHLYHFIQGQPIGAMRNFIISHKSSKDIDTIVQKYDYYIEGHCEIEFNIEDFFSIEILSEYRVFGLSNKSNLYEIWNLKTNKCEYTVLKPGCIIEIFELSNMYLLKVHEGGEYELLIQS